MVDIISYSLCLYLVLTFVVFFFVIRNVLKEKTSSLSFVLERPTSPFPIQLLHRKDNLELQFNRGQVPVATWNKTLLASNLQPSTESSGNSGFFISNSKFLTPQGRELLGNPNEHAILHEEMKLLTEEEYEEGEWAHGSFPLEEYIKALDRSKGEMYYDHSLGMRYTKVWIFFLLV